MLEWEKVFDTKWRAPAILFGHIIVDFYDGPAGGWCVNWSAPGIQDGFRELPRYYPSAEQAMTAADTLVRNKVTKFLERQA